MVDAPMAEWLVEGVVEAQNVGSQLHQLADHHAPPLLAAKLPCTVTLRN